MTLRVKLITLAVARLRAMEVAHVRTMARLQTATGRRREKLLFDKQVYEYEIANESEMIVRVRPLLTAREEEMLRDVLRF